MRISYSIIGYKNEKMAGDKHIPNSKWNEDRANQGYQLALLGLTDRQIADVMEVDVTTLEYWKRNKPGFFERLQAGKEEADMKVVNAFYQNCLDRWVEIEEVHIYKGSPIKVKVRKFIQGDKWAQNKWLSLRQPGKWSETHKIELTQTNININKFDFSGLSEQELLTLKKAGLKQIALNSEN